MFFFGGGGAQRMRAWEGSIHPASVYVCTYNGAGGCCCLGGGEYIKEHCVLLLPTQQPTRPTVRLALRFPPPPSRFVHTNTGLNPDCSREFDGGSRAGER